MTFSSSSSFPEISIRLKPALVTVQTERDLVLWVASLLAIRVAQRNLAVLKYDKELLKR